MTSTFEAAEYSSHQNVISLLDVSLGRLNDLEVKDHLGIDSDEDLFILMAHNHLPMPRLSSDKTQDVAESLMPSVPEVVRASPSVIVKRLPKSGGINVVTH